MRVGYAKVPSFYAAVERLDDPGLRARPVLVGGNPDKGGKVQSATHEALEAGVEVGMLCERALALCPDAALCPTNMKRYRELSVLLQTSLRQVTEGIEGDGLAGAYFDIAAGSDHDDDEEDERTFARRMVKAVREDLGLGLRVGVAPVKFLARLAAEEPDDDGFRFVANDQVAAFLSVLSPERLPGVGVKTRATLASLRIQTVEQLLKLDPREVENHLGAHGRRILGYARGEDEARIRTAAHRKTLSHEVTFEEPVAKRSAIEPRLAELCQTVEAGLRQQQLCASRVAIKLRYGAGKPETRSRKLVRPIVDAAEIYSAAKRLLDRTEVGQRPVTLLGVALAGLAPPAEIEATAQLDLFS